MGIVLWELLTARRLFSSANQVTTIGKVCFDPIPSPRSVDASVSRGLEQIALRALERPRAKRYATAEAFAEELEKAARADVGIATQREVAACLSKVLRSDMVERPEAVGGEAVKGSAPTHQLPASDPMIVLPGGHLPLSGELSITELSGYDIDVDPDG